MKTFDKGFGISLIVFLILTGATCYLPNWFTGQPLNKPDFGKTGDIGDTIGGTMGPFVGILGGLFTYLAFWVQYKANEQQKQDLKEQKDRANVERFETRFFEILKLHRDNVSEMTYTSFSRDKDGNTYSHTDSSRKVFKAIFSDFEKLNDELAPFFDSSRAKVENVYIESYLTQIKNNETLIKRQIDLLTYAKLDILYCILFFGVGASGRETIESFFEGRYSENFYAPILKFATLKPKKESNSWISLWKNLYRLHSHIDWDKWNKELYKKPTVSWSELAKEGGYDGIIPARLFSTFTLDYKHDKYYGGHQFRLGHYFRHLYQTITYIDENKQLSYSEKYDNVKLLRGQLSTYEQLIIFVNSVSILGRVWELETKHEPSKAVEVQHQLMTKYNFVKNIAYDKIIEGISVSAFYPNIVYEATRDAEIIKKRKELERIYKEKIEVEQPIKFFKIPFVNYAVIKKKVLDGILENMRDS